MKRRLAVQAILSVPLTAVAASALPRQTTQMIAKPYWVYFGTYTKPQGSRGLYRSLFDPETGDMSIPLLAAEMENPTFLAISPGGDCLYAVSETSQSGSQGNEGTVYAFRINKVTGALTFLNSRPTAGAYPVYVSVNSTGRFAIVANYGGGSSAVFALQSDGSLGKLTDFKKHAGVPGPNAKRQESAHAHCAQFSVIDRVEYAYVVDLGLDQIFAYRLDERTGRLLPLVSPSLKLEAGSGPRHLAFSNSDHRAYVVGELNSTCTILQSPPRSHGVIELVPSTGRHPNPLSTLPIGVSPTLRQLNTSAEVLVHPSGRYVLVSNRGDDSLVVYSKLNGNLSTEGFIRSQPGRIIKTPRNFNFDPSGSWLFVANQDGDSILFGKWQGVDTVFSQNVVPLSSPVCVKFVEKS
jgi:6-phosphogluconolactonase